MDRSSGGPSSPQLQDPKTEHAVLGLVLHEHPTRLTMNELLVVFDAYPDLRGSGGATEEAVYQLLGAGLLQRDGSFLVPTRAALYFWRLEDN